MRRFFMGNDRITITLGFVDIKTRRDIFVL